jgi:hypothetical protein
MTTDRKSGSMAAGRQSGSRLDQWATLKNGVIAVVLFGLNGLLLAGLDQRLTGLASGEPKLDLRFGYDLATVQRLMGAYGAEGRSTYVWNLVADTPFPILGAIAVSLFALLAFRGRSWLKLLILPPLLFGVTDLVENALLVTIVGGYPALWPGLIAVASRVTQVKRAAYYTSMLELIVSVLLVALLEVKHRRSSASSV